MWITHRVDTRARQRGRTEQKKTKTPKVRKGKEGANYKYSLRMFHDLHYFNTLSLCPFLHHNPDSSDQPPYLVSILDSFHVRNGS